MRHDYSHTRRSVLAKCQLQYFFEYHAAKVEAPPPDRQRSLFAQVESDHESISPRLAKRAGLLRQLQNLYQLAGQILHRQIAEYLRAGASRTSDLPQRARNQFRYGLDRARQLARHMDGIEAMSATGQLIEFYYGDPAAEELASDVEHRLSSAMTRFIDDQAIQALVQSMLQGTGLAIEKKISGIERVDRYVVQGQVDFASAGSWGVRILDWKMGSSIGDEDSLQLAIYARWAMAHFHVPPESVIVQRVFLGDGTIEPERRMDRASIRRSWARLVQDIEWMRGLDEYGRKGVMDAFTPCGKERVCRQCKFQGICPARRVGLDSKPTSEWCMARTDA